MLNFHPSFPSQSFRGKSSAHILMAQHVDATDCPDEPVQRGGGACCPLHAAQPSSSPPTAVARPQAPLCTELEVKLEASLPQPPPAPGLVAMPPRSFGAGGPVPELVRRMLAAKHEARRASQPAMEAAALTLAGWRSPHTPAGSQQPRPGSARSSPQGSTPPPKATPSGQHVLRGPTPRPPSKLARLEHGASGGGAGGARTASQGPGGPAHRSYPADPRGGPTHPSALRPERPAKSEAASARLTTPVPPNPVLTLS